MCSVLLLGVFAWAYISWRDESALRQHENYCNNVFHNLAFENVCDSYSLFCFDAAGSRYMGKDATHPCHDVWSTKASYGRVLSDRNQAFGATSCGTANYTIVTEQIKGKIPYQNPMTNQCPQSYGISCRCWNSCEKAMEKQCDCIARNASDTQCDTNVEYCLGPFQMENGLYWLQKEGKNETPPLSVFNHSCQPS